jgi:hypothetical protein
LRWGTRPCCPETLANPLNCGFGLGVCRAQVLREPIGRGGRRPLLGLCRRFPLLTGGAAEPQLEAPQNRKMPKYKRDENNDANSTASQRRRRRDG